MAFTHEEMPKDEVIVMNGSTKKAENGSVLDSPSTHRNHSSHGKEGQTSLAMRHLYETMQEITVEPKGKDEPDVKAFFKVLRNHRLQSKLTYVITVAGIVLTSHCVLSKQWLMPWLFSVWTPSLLFYRLILYWKMKYQYFMLDFCYFANMYCFTYIWVAPSREDMFAVGFSIASGPLIWSLLVFRNSLVFHSLDKVTSLYIHLMPGLLTFVIRWYPEETGMKWHKPFPTSEMGFNFLWLVLVPLCFHSLHQIIYGIVVNLILKPSLDYLNLFRYVTRKEDSLTFRLCNMFGPKYRILLYMGWTLIMVFGMLILNPLWYNYFIANCVMMAFFIVVAVYNGATYYVDVFSLEGIDKHRSSKSELSNPVEGSDVMSPENVKTLQLTQTEVTCLASGDQIQTKPAV